MNAARDSAVTRESHPDGEPLQDGISPLIGLTMLVARVALRSLTRVTVDGACGNVLGGASTATAKPKTAEPGEDGNCVGARPVVRSRS